MGGKQLATKQQSLIGALFSQVGLYGRSASFFAVLVLVAIGGYTYIKGNNLQAESVPTELDQRLQNDSTVVYNLTKDGRLLFGNSRQNPEIFTTEGTYRYRLQVLNRPNDYISEYNVAVRLPAVATEQTVAYRFINNGGASSATSELLDPKTLLFSATDIGSEAQLAIEFEIPKSFVSRSAIFLLKERLNQLPSVLWTGISIGLPLLTALLLLVVGLARMRRVSPLNQSIEAPPSRLSPALVGILLRGRLTSRALAATLLDLARRGHLIIRHLSSTDFRFQRHIGNDRLEDFEKVLLDQIFGPGSEHATGEEVNFALAQEVFSKRVSQSFILAYRKVNNLGFFYTSPLKLHRRYQLVGILLFLLGVAGFFATLLLFTGIGSLLFFWVGMILAALVVTFFSRSLPTRTVFGDRELARWLAFGRYLGSTEMVNFAASSQEKYLSYLPYAVIFEVETEWTRRFYDLPFVQPDWYVSANVTTVDQFANKVFPLFGYLSHALALTTAPAVR